MENEWGESAEERVSFDDSDQFDEDSMSLCSWMSENDIVEPLKWRGWNRTATVDSTRVVDLHTSDKVLSLIELSAKVVAKYYPFQSVEEHNPSIPDQIQLKVAFWSFPQNEDEIQLYCCLAHGSLEEFQKADLIIKQNKVQELYQIGFHLSARILHNNAGKQEPFNVAVTFDRCQIISSNCTCNPNATWCAHITALCLYRIRYPDNVIFRVPVSESLSRLERNQLQKFAQYLINELPPQVLPTAQKLLDDLLNSPCSAINTFHGAPDPTAGANLNDDPKWCLDETSLHDHIRKILCKFSGPSPVAFVDLNSMFLASSAPLPSLEWSNFLRPLSSREPEGIWNLMDIVRDLFKRQDKNSLKILQILTDECLNFHQLTLRWFITETEDGEETAPTGNRRNHGNQNRNHSNQNYSNSNVASNEYAKHTGARLQNEIVNLWKVALMNPFLTESERQSWKVNLETWQKMTIDKARRGFSGGEQKFNSALSRFNGFMPAIIASENNWKISYESLGIDLGVSCSSLDHQNSKSASKSIPRCLPDNIELDDLFSCMEALHHLGFSLAAEGLAVLLAEKLLSRYSIKDQTTEAKDNCDRISEASKVAFICEILKENNENQHLAFKIAILGLGLPRYPVESKSLEVKLAHCEMTLRSALKLVVISNKEMELIRKYARFLLNVEMMADKMVIPFILAIYVFEVLCDAQIQSNVLMKQKIKFETGCELKKQDHELGYQAAITTLGRTSSISETQHPMACESMRRFRNDLALSMMLHYKDDAEKIKTILSLLLNIEKYESCKDVDEHYLCSADQKNNKFHVDTEVKNLNESMKNRNKIEHCVDLKSSWPSRSGSREQKDQAVVLKSDSNVNISQERDSNSLEMPEGPEDWDAEINEEKCVSGTVTGILQFDVNIANQQSDICHVESDSTNDRSSTSSCPNEQVETLAEDEQCLPKDFEKISLENCDPSRSFGNVVVSGLTNEEERPPRCHASTSQSLDSTNQWDPALSWADAVEDKTKGNLAHRVSGEPCSFDNKRSTRGKITAKKSRKNITFDSTRVESDSYALFELAKNALSKASLDSDQNSFGAENDQNSSGRVHRGLRLAAFEIGLFSLNLQNHVSPKWMSRTYSSYVSWIAAQAIDIGSTALRLLNEKWQGVLTPSEVIDIANRASRLGEPLLRRTAAELAVSCLPQAHTLNPGEIQQALTLCKEIDTQMLVRACNAIECASKSGGIQPEMLFLIARQWHYIHEKALEEANRDVQLGNRTATKGQQNNQTLTPAYQSTPIGHAVLQFNKRSQQRERDVSNPIQHPSPVAILTPEQYVQQQMHQMAQEMLARNLSQQGHNASLSDEMTSFSWIYPQYLGSSLHHCPMPQHVLLGKSISKHDAISMPIVNYVSDDEESEHIPQQLQNAYRVGMKALESLANRGSDERACVKYSPSPPCSDDVRWLCALAASLGPQFLRRFCTIVIGAVSSPYVLHDIALEAARHFALYNPAQLASHLRSPCVSPIVVKCLAMYTELVRHNLVLLSQGGYTDFVDLLRRARSAFCMAPGGMTKFNELLEMIRKKYPKKRDLWQLIMNGLSRA